MFSELIVANIIIKGKFVFNYFHTVNKARVEQETGECKSLLLTVLSKKRFTHLGMLKITKIFYFEMAHAIHGYSGACKDIHGHSYELHVTVSATIDHKNYLPSPGFIIDFKELKKQVQQDVIIHFDHKVCLSQNFLAAFPGCATLPNLIIWEAEPTAENILITIQQVLQKSFPVNVTLEYLKLFETKDSYAEWIKNTIVAL